MALMGSDLLAIDTETSGVGWHDEAFMISVAWRGPNDSLRSYAIDKREVSDNAWRDELEGIENMLEGCKRIIMHNAKFDIQKLCRLGFPMRLFKDKFEDTQALAHLINEQGSTGLKYLARTILGEVTDEDEVLRKTRRELKVKKEDGYYPIPRCVLEPYAIKDAEFTLRLYERFVKTFPKDLYSLYELEKQLTIALLGIEARGMQINKTYVKQQRKEYGDRIYKLKYRIGELVGEDFNPQSPQQVLHALGERGHVVSSTSKQVLSEVPDELAGLIIELREANKIKSTYFEALHTEAKGGILHPNFRQHGTKTGRMSSGAAEA